MSDAPKMARASESEKRAIVTTTGLMDDSQRTRVESALDESMSIDVYDDHVVVKGKYTVKPSTRKCSCPDHEYRGAFCKHLIRVHLELMFGNISLAGTDDRAPRPEALAVAKDEIPRDLRSRDQWVGWRYQYLDDRDYWTKVPIDVRTMAPASVTDSETWADFSSVYELYTTGKVDGLGFVLTETDPFVGIDIDNCRDPETGAIGESATALVLAAETYTEVSPSGTGLRLFIRAEKSTHETQATLRDGTDIEVYDRMRYLTVTGHTIGPAPTHEVPDRPETMGFLDEWVGGEK